MATAAGTGWRVWELVVFASGCAVLLGLSAAYFPMFLAPDSIGYMSAAREIERVFGDDALSILDLRTTFRILGYPALLAALQPLAGEDFGLVLLALQAAAVLLSALVLFALLRRLGVSLAWTVLLAGLYVAAWPRHLAGFVLTDALNNALTAIAVCVLVEPLFRDMEITLRRMLAAGLLIAAAFLLRESNRYLIVCLLPVAGVLTWTLAVQRHQVRRAVFVIPVFVLPLLATVEAYKAFNQARFGERFVTTGGRTVMLQPLMPVAKQHPDLFDGASKFDAKAQDSFKAYDLTEILAFNAYWLEQGISEQRLADWAFAKYAEAWRRYPLAMIGGVLDRFRIDRQASELLNPPGSVYITERWRQPGLPSETSVLIKAWRSGDAGQILQAVMLVAGRVLSVLVFAGFLIGVPAVALMAWRRGQTRLALGCAAILVSYLGYCLVFALVNLETRYLGGIAVMIAIGAGVVIRSPPWRA